jgi:thiamine kinase-like enzyme
MYPFVMSLSATQLEHSFGALLNRVPRLRNRSEISELSGGLTNRNLKVTTESGIYVARISSNESNLLSIDREAEYRNSIIAAEAGVAAPVYDYLPGAGLLVIGFLPGHTYDAENVAANLPRIAQSIRRLHQAKPFVRDFDMFEIQKGYLSIVKERGFKIPDEYEDLARYGDELFKALKATDEGKVPCNNDLLAANFIDDGAKIWLIDYEYSGNNDPCFELGNLWAESFLPIESLRELVTAYYGEDRPDKFARAWLLSVYGKYGWTLWASIQDGISELDFDFWTWGMKKYSDVLRDFGSDFYHEQLSSLRRNTH